MGSRFYLFFHLLFGFTSCVFSEDVTVSCFYLENCVLPCPFEPGHDHVIHWTKPEDLPVHIYFFKQHQTQHQHQNYTGRTSLSNDGISTGDASLLLQKVKVHDEGRYKCYVNTVNPDEITESYVNLKVYTPVLQMSFQQKQNQLLCRAEDIYPRPAVTWTFSPEPQDQPQTTVTPSESGLFSVLSSVPLTQRPPLEYSCNVSTEYWRSATYRRNNQISKSSLVAVSCTKPSAPVKSLIWSFKHNEIILNKTGSEPVYTESWRPFVELTESNSLELKDLTQDQLGLFRCELFTESEQFIIDTRVTEGQSLRLKIGLIIPFILSVIIIIFLLICYIKNLKSQIRDNIYMMERSSGARNTPNNKPVENTEMIHKEQNGDVTERDTEQQNGASPPTERTVLENHRSLRSDVSDVEDNMAV